MEAGNVFINNFLALFGLFFSYRSEAKNNAPYIYLFESRKEAEEELASLKAAETISDEDEEQE